MSSEVNSFRWVVPLKHMALVKIVQLLWRHSEGKEWLKEHYEDVLQSGPTESVLQHFEIPDDKLPVPVGMKSDFTIFFKNMVFRAISWLHSLENWQDSRKEGEIQESFITRVTYSIDNFSWTNDGCIDGETMLKSYVSNKETIDLGTWAQLCEYCVEEDIIKFSKTMDWNNCKQFVWDADLIYWYWKIYGELPTQAMISKDNLECGSYVDFECQWKERFSDEKKTNRFFLDWAASSLSCSTFRYLCNRMESSGGLAEFSFHADFFVTDDDDENLICIVREMNNETIHKFIKNNIKFFTCLIDWPWALFIDNWIHLLEDATNRHFERLFAMLYHKIKNREEELKWSYELWEKVWRVFYEKFGFDENSLTKVLIRIGMDGRDNPLWEMIRQGMDDSRRISLAKGLMLSPSRTDIAKKLLKNDEEREMVFRKY